MTLLEFVMVSELGPPAGSHYTCPAESHRSPSVFAFDPHPVYKDRWKCLRCGARGDVFDLLILAYPREDYGARLARLASHRQRFESGQLPGKAGHTFPPVGSTRGAERDYRQALQLAWADLTNAERKLVARACEFLLAHIAAGGSQDGFALPPDMRGWGARFANVANHHRVNAGDLARECHQAEQWFAESDRVHAADCDDTDCNVDPCRAARGLPPLTEAEWEAVREKLYAEADRAREEHERAAGERFARAIAPLNAKMRQSLQQKAAAYPGGVNAFMLHLARQRA